MDPGRFELAIERGAGDTLAVRLTGSWRLAPGLPRADDVLDQAGEGVRRIAFDGKEITEWDAALLSFVLQVVEGGRERDIESDPAGLPDGVRRLLALALAAPKREDASREEEKLSPLARIGTGAIGAWNEARAQLEFLGEATLSFGRLLRGRARFRRRDLLLAIQECGAEALGIVGLISFLVGLILAFMGAVQLRVFGAEIYVADLVAIGMAREMGTMMTGIMLAGRTGAAYAAQLGTMTVNEEIDALRGLGLKPIDFLVLPRMLALMLMTPLLVLYSNLLGILGGLVVGVWLLDIPVPHYWSQTTKAVHLGDFGVGLIKAAVIGTLVAIAGCMRGMRCGRSASAVGLATTSAVVTAIVMIVVAEAIFAVIFEALGI